MIIGHVGKGKTRLLTSFNLLSDFIAVQKKKHDGKKIYIDRIIKHDICITDFYSMEDI